jgi:LCP family protein required for cell wall assembly
MDGQIPVDRTGEELGAAEIDADDTALGHAARLPLPAPMADDDDRPYTTYRARPKFLQGRDEPRRNGREAGTPEEPGRPPGTRRPFRGPGRIGVGRVAKWVAIALGLWILVSGVLFLISAQIQESKISSAAERQLSGSGFTLTSANTILVLGSDARPKGTKEAGAQVIGQASRSDSILLMRVGGGKNATLSIPRDTVVDIPGHGRNKINAAYAIGGPSLAIKTVESYLGIDVNHLVEVNFDNFPQLIDALGGITYKGGCVVSEINGGNRNGGYTLRLKAGTHEIDGKQALALARTRHNACAKREDDRTRARRQQKILAAIKGKVTSFETFVRLPWVSWAAPKAVRSDMAGPSLLGLVGAEMVGGSSTARVLKPSGNLTLPDGGAGLVVDDAEKRKEVRRFLKG